MEKENSRWILENKDTITFDIKVEKPDVEGTLLKQKNLTITLGKEELYPGIDDLIVGQDLSNTRIFQLALTVPENAVILNTKFEPGDYIFGFKVRDIKKFNSREILEMSKMKDTHNDKQRIKELEELNNNLREKIEKLDAEKKLSEQTFKAKAEEFAKTAASKVEVLKEEIKNQAKEEIDYKTKFAIQKLVDDLLSPLNNLYVAVESGANSTDPNVSAYVKGFQMLTNQIFQTLESHGIVPIEPKEGDVFDPAFHHAQEIVADPMFKKDQITKLISRGYRLHERVLKPATVIVAK